MRGLGRGGCCRLVDHASLSRRVIVTSKTVPNSSCLTAFAGLLSRGHVGPCPRRMKVAAGRREVPARPPAARNESLTGFRGCWSCAGGVACMEGEVLLRLTASDGQVRPAVEVASAGSSDDGFDGAGHPDAGSDAGHAGQRQGRCDRWFKTMGRPHGELARHLMVETEPRLWDGSLAGRSSANPRAIRPMTGGETGKRGMGFVRDGKGAEREPREISRV
ncbi:hypothetical protein ACCO45_007085 [Purpureocillium lilacinum]|uniref:Uncharacterized protein n=1 Tax=Purpureocillium lilacinum TaxID=33203 RepID=A0ACC4DSE0_PURLI